MSVRDYRGYWDWLPRLLGDCCGGLIRFTLFVVLIINLSIASALIQRFTGVNGVTVQSTQPPPSVLFSEVVAAVSLAWVVLSFCLLRMPVLLLVGDTIFFVAWFAASIILGVSLNQTLRFSCQQLAIVLTGGSQFGGFTGVSGGIGGFGSSFGGGFASNSLAQQVFDSCNISKSLFSFHVIATVLFIGVAMSAAITASGASRRKASRPEVQQQNNYYGQPYPGDHRRQQAVPEIIV